MKEEQLNELLLQALEHEKGGVKIYEAAIDCAVNEDLREEWENYLEQTQKHVAILENVIEQFKLDPETECVGRDVVRMAGEGLLDVMSEAKEGGDPQAAQIVAAECVVLAETKDHLNWELLGVAAKKLKGDKAKVLKAAYDEVEDQEDEHLYHTRGWCRELWLECLGLEAVLPPPEETKHVKTAIGAARVEKQRKSG